MTTEPLRKRLLLVDDYRDGLEMWSTFLQASGYDVLTASTGREALDLAESGRPDLILLDLQLPDISGIEAARLLRASPATARMPMIAVTGFSQKADHDTARQAGFDAVIVKPCDPPALLDQVARLLASTTSAS